MNKLTSSIKIIWFIRFFLRVLLLSIIVLVLEFTALKEFNGIFLFKSGLAISIFILGTTFSAVWPIVKFNYWAFDIRRDEVYIQRGVINRIRSTAPFKRIQHIDVQQGFGERMVGISRLIIYTAGTRGADLVIPGLPINYAEDLRDKLKNIANEDAV